MLPASRSVLSAALLAGMVLVASPAQAQVWDNTYVTDENHEGVDRIEIVDSDDPEMDAAIAAARATLPEWLDLLASPPAGVDYIVFKFPLGGVEHIWVDNVRRQGDMLVGEIANHPVIDGYSINERVMVPISDVSDWGWWDADGIAHGYRTTAVLLDRIDPAEAERYRRQLGWLR